MKYHIIRQIVTVFVILTIAAFFRLQGINWDKNNHLHPDERFLTMVTLSLKWPSGINGYLDTETSTLNPHNTGYGFYVYGLFPLLVVKAISELVGQYNYDGLTIIGRYASVITELAIIVTVFYLTKFCISSLKKIPQFVRDAAPIIAMLAYALFPLPIQLSHFFTTDPYLTFFSALTILFMLQKKYPAMIGISLGLAISSKISAVMLLPTIALSVFVDFLENRKIRNALMSVLLICVTAILTTRIAYPYLFTLNNSGFGINQNVISNWKELKSYDNPDAAFPPAIQWINTQPILWPLVNLAFFGLGLPGFLAVIGGILYCILKYRKDRNIFLILVFTASVFIYQGIQFVKAMRYFYLLYPLFAVFAGIFLSHALSALVSGKIRLISFIFSLSFLLMMPVMQMSIYTRNHSRIEASQWIFRNIPTSSHLLTEHWDDGLPVPIDNRPNSLYKTTQMPVFYPDTPEKIQELNQLIKNGDYYILSSNRGYGAILSAPDKFPLTSEFYRSLFTNRTSYEKIAEFAVRPNLPIPFISLCIIPPYLSYGKTTSDTPCHEKGITLVDDYADETWTVYDHPKVTIFRNRNIK